MKLVKIFSLTAIATIATMAFVGTSAASADPDSVVLCLEPELLCEKGNWWPNPTTIIAHATNPKILSSVGTIECEKALLELTLLNQLAKLIQGHVLSWNLEGNCHLGSTKCTVTTAEVGALSLTHGPNPLEWIWVATPLVGESSKNTVKTVKCGFLINCTFTLGEETKLTATNSGEGTVTVTANEAEIKSSSGFCPATAKLDGTYVMLGNDAWLES